MIPSSVLSQSRSISRAKCLASWGEWITSNVSSLVWAAEGDQLKDPFVIDHGDLWWRSLRWVSQPGFSWILTPLKPFVEPEGFGREERATAGYELEGYSSFCLGAALSQIAVEELDLEKTTCAAEQQRRSPTTGEA